MNRSFVFFALLCLVQSSVFGDLLINGNAESSNFTGWTLSGDNIHQCVPTRKQATGWVYPAQGDYFFSFARYAGSYAMMSQTGLIDNNVKSLALGGFFQGEYSDYGVAGVTIYDQAGVELLTENTGNLTTENLSWETFQIEVVLPENSYSWEVTLEGFLYYGKYVNVFYDDVYLIPEVVIPINLDIKPQSCPNPFNVNSKGVLPVAIPGSETVNVNDIDIDSIQLAGVSPIRSNYEDVATGLVDPIECECSTEGPDGYIDLTLKFEIQAIADALGEAYDGEEFILYLTGYLYDGTAIEGSDCIIIRRKGRR